MAFTSPAYTPTSQPYHHEPMYNDEALASMSPELLGSARLPPMTPEQRQEYVDGITIKAKYVGTIEVPEPKGEQMILTAISRVRAHHKAQKEHKQRVWLSISTSGLKILHFDNFSLQDSYALSQISYTTILPSNKRVFAFISANTSVQPPIFKCHVFKSNSKASIITLTLGRCFSIALEDARSQGVRFNRQGDHHQHAFQAQSRSLEASAPPLSDGQASPHHGFGYSNGSNPASFPRAGFEQIMREISIRTDQVAISPQDHDYLTLRYTQLSMLYQEAQEKLNGAERRAMAARSSMRA
eukprot:TRINITY_DN9805_c0_g1_i2.p1 TRINITY_DN9805_c0_g1~~TRINITY_DN9805_c0_g1_i2.p1  ORF type:complete len:298 (+),score=34.01 TRINITY_DN9805_c0_g1_i2:434-1327(+)